MALEFENNAINLALETFAPSDCPIIKNAADPFLLKANIYMDEGVIENVRIKCEGTDNLICVECQINNKVSIKHF